METKTLYRFDELSESAKEKARDWFRQDDLNYDWWDYVHDDAATIGALLGIRIDRIYFSGFWSQGDGACFEGGYQYRKGSIAAIKAYAPQDTELHGLAIRLQQLQRKAFYGLSASCEQRGFYNHSGCMRVSVEHDKRDATDSEEDDLTQMLRDFADWIYSRLESEYEYLTSDEAVDENIRINEYEFDEDGEIQ
jgi:hypothetical protein